MTCDSTVALCSLGLVGGMFVYWLGGAPAVVMLAVVVAIGLTGVRVYQRVTAPRPESLSRKNEERE